MLWISGFTLALLIGLMPETLADAVLLRRARRLRKLTGDDRYRSMGEIKESLQTAGDITREALVRPFVLMLECVLAIRFMTKTTILTPLFLLGHRVSPSLLFYSFSVLTPDFPSSVFSS